MEMLYEKDTEPRLILERKVVVIGFGAQGRAHALNLRDSGVDVVVGLRKESESMAVVEANGISHADSLDAVSNADVITLLIPDTAQPDFYQAVVEPQAKTGAMLVFAHGFNLHYQRIKPRPDLDVVLVAPLGVGDQVREVYARGGGVPALLAIHQDASGSARDLGLSYAAAMGHGRAGIIETSIAEETESDLFAEQAVLCGGLTHLIEAAFETLVEAGYRPEVAYFCCLHEVKLIADLVQTRGIAGMRESISPIAEFGDYTAGPRIIDAETRRTLDKLLTEIRSGEFARRVDAESSEFREVVTEGRKRAREHLLEKTGAALRAKMNWLNDKD